MKNKKGSMGLAILSTIAVFVIGLMFVNFIIPEVTNFRINLGCTDIASVSDGTKILCLFGDATVPYFILGVISLAVGAITSRLRL